MTTEEHLDLIDKRLDDFDSALRQLREAVPVDLEQRLLNTAAKADYRANRQALDIEQLNSDLADLQVTVSNCEQPLRDALCKHATNRNLHLQSP